MDYKLILKIIHCIGAETGRETIVRWSIKYRAYELSTMGLIDGKRHRYALMFKRKVLEELQDLVIAVYSWNINKVFGAKKQKIY